MSDRLIQAVETALSRLAQELHKDASVVVQFAAGDWHELKAALGEAKGDPAPADGSAAPAPPEVPPPPASAETAPADSIPPAVETYATGTAALGTPEQPS